jgi:hypothetical protein
MNKVLKVPDELIREIKILAAMSDKSVKKYLEGLIANAVSEELKKLKK